jgi:DNA (cytosine-5)-methyltransferase 1
MADFYEHLYNEEKLNILTRNGFFADEFPVETQNLTVNNIDIFRISKDKYKTLETFSEEFAARFFNTGICIDGKAYTIETTPILRTPKTLNEICENDFVDERFFLNGSLDKWKYLKGSKREERKRPNGEIYYYTEGSMAFPDKMDSPSRTMLTSESSLNRSTHVVIDKQTGRYRLLTPLECERLNGFDDNWTDTGMPEKFRYFVMGNALVVPLIEKMGSKILKITTLQNVYNIKRQKQVALCS